jgi:3-oxoacyl-ACP reductase-like protein
LVYFASLSLSLLTVNIPNAPKTTIRENGDIIYEEIPRPGIQSFEDYVKEMFTEVKGVPAICIKSRSTNSDHTFVGWTLDNEMTRLYACILKEIATEGISFKNRRVLITGCGRGSIGAELLQSLLMGGAKVVVTTSNFTKKTTQFYRSIYEKYGSFGSCLVLLPFNQVKLSRWFNITYIYAHSSTHPPTHPPPHSHPHSH